MSTGDAVFYTAMLGVIPVLLLTFTLTNIPASYYEMRSKNLSRFLALTAMFAPIAIALAGVALFFDHGFLAIKIVVLILFLGNCLGLMLAVGRGLGGRYFGHGPLFRADSWEYWEKKDREREQKDEEGD